MQNRIPEFSKAGRADLLTVDVTNATHCALLREAYDGVYTEAFPLADERVEFSLWLDLADPKSAAPVRLPIILAGRDLYGEKPEIDGISVGMYYTDSQTALIGYNAVSPKCQGQGLGSAMQNALRHEFNAIASSRGDSLRGVFVEVNDPAKETSQQDQFDPAKRMMIYRKWGAFDVPVTYVQPALGPESEKFRDAKLLYYPVNGAHPTVTATGDFLDSMYKSYGYADPSTDEDFAKMIAELERLPSSRLGPAQPGTPDIAAPKL